MNIKLALIFSSALLLAACVTSTTPQQLDAPIKAPALVQSDNSSFSALLNDFRVSQGRSPVGRNATLDRAAQRHAQDMVKRSYFSHQSPGGPNGDTFIDRSRTAGCRSLSGAENIANGQQSEATVIEAWKNSPGHRRNMLVANYTQYGLGREGNVWVLVFSGSC